MWEVRPAIKKFVKRIIYKAIEIPFSPRIFRGYVRILRAVGAIRTPAAPPVRNPLRILISYPINRVGDNVYLLPFLDLVHRTWPQAKIHVATGEHIAPLIREISFLEEVFPCPSVAHRGLILWRFREIQKTICYYEEKIANYSYDLAFAPRWVPDGYSVLCRYLLYLTNARRRCAYSATVAGGTRALDALLTDVAYGGHAEHEALRYLRLLERSNLAGANENALDLLRSQNCILQGIAEKYSGNQVVDLIRQWTGKSLGEYIIISPGSVQPNHVWSRDKFAAVMKELNRAYGAKFLIVGANSDRSLCESLAAELPDHAYSIGGKTTLPELVAVLYRACLFVGNDSGPGHLAAGLGVPTVSINPFPLHGDPGHQDSATRNWPNGPRVCVVQPLALLAPCSLACHMMYSHCVNQVAEQDVLRAAVKFLRESRSESGANSAVCATGPA